MKKTFTTMEANIDYLRDEESNITSSDRKDSYGNSHFQRHNKLKSFTGTKKFKTEREYYVKTPVVTTPTSVMPNQKFEERNRKVMFKKSHDNSIKIELRNIILIKS